MGSRSADAASAARGLEKSLGNTADSGEPGRDRTFKQQIESLLPRGLHPCTGSSLRLRKVVTLSIFFDPIPRGVRFSARQAVADSCDRRSISMCGLSAESPTARWPAARFGRCRRSTRRHCVTRDQLRPTGSGRPVRAGRMVGGVRETGNGHYRHLDRTVRRFAESMGEATSWHPAPGRRFSGALSEVDRRSARAKS